VGRREKLDCCAAQGSLVEARVVKRRSGVHVDQNQPHQSLLRQSQRNDRTCDVLRAIRVQYRHYPVVHTAVLATKTEKEAFQMQTRDVRVVGSQSGEEHLHPLGRVADGKTATQKHYHCSKSTCVAVIHTQVHPHGERGR